ncbi:MAG TPA: hypothetical protein PLX23_00860 [Candidatus Hydrogenedens sp.]|nr:hypothetical protein [Candidatus Hydrogenedens sp.]
MVFVLIFFLFSPITFAQSFMEDLFRGKLISSELGVWVIYEITDKSTNKSVFLRQAITGIEKIDEKTTGIWLESEIIPLEGFPSVYRVLISYDSNGKEKVHKIVIREGADAPQNIDVSAMPDVDINQDKYSKKKLIGEEEVQYKNGKIKTKHYKIEEDNKSKEVWLNDEIKPLGIVKLSTNEGDMILIKFGKGGDEGKSALDLPAQKNIPPNSRKPQVDVSTTNNQGK